MIKMQSSVGCLNYMSEDDVNDMFPFRVLLNYMNQSFGDDEDDDDDGQPDEAQEWHDFDPDC